MGKFIVLEGVTSTGKTTLGKMLVDRFNSKGIEAFFNHEPTISTPYGRLIRSIVEENPCSESDVSEAGRLPYSKKNKFVADVLSKLKNKAKLNEIERQILYIADRHEDLMKNIMPKIARGALCIQDRYELSTYAFASTKNISFEKLNKLHSEMLKDAYIIPDALLYLDLRPETALDRLKNASNKPVDIYETSPKIKKTRDAYKKLLKNNSLYKTLYVIDAEPPLLEVFSAICLRLNI